MKRREFLAVSGAAGLLPITNILAADGQAAGGERDYYQLQLYHLDTDEQRQGFDAFARQAAIPALNRLGISPVGVFYPQTDLSPVYVLLRHPSLESVTTLVQQLGGDQEFLERGAAFLDAPADKPAYRRMESSLLAAFRGMPRLETPVKSAGRICQLRIYESPSVKTGQKKIEMFNDAGEIEIFRRVGLNPVFFGEALVGSKLPNLTYMLMFESEDAMKAGWKKFGGDPDWQRLRGMDEYADRNILSGITNLLLKPAEYSQI
jgi:hypothetical protein